MTGVGNALWRTPSIHVGELAQPDSTPDFTFLAILKHEVRSLSVTSHAYFERQTPKMVVAGLRTVLKGDQC